MFKIIIFAIRSVSQALRQLVRSSYHSRKTESSYCTTNRPSTRRPSTIYMAINAPERAHFVQSDQRSHMHNNRQEPTSFLLRSHYSLHITHQPQPTPINRLLPTSARSPSDTRPIQCPPRNHGKHVNLKSPTHHAHGMRQHIQHPSSRCTK